MPSPTGTRPPLFARLPQRTLELLDEMSEKTGYSRTEVVMIAIETLHKEMSKRGKIPPLKT
jgi:metal-responsive CopG/Arc/MetJ family transcriptional regulator